MQLWLLPSIVLDSLAIVGQVRFSRFSYLAPTTPKPDPTKTQTNTNQTQPPTQTNQGLVADCLGRARVARARKVAKALLRYGAASGAAVALGYLVGAPWILGVISPDAAVAAKVGLLIAVWMHGGWMCGVDGLTL